MQTVYLIGNGFDVNLGLPTKYPDFYKYYLGLDRVHDTENIYKLKDHLEKCLSSKTTFWSDLEEAMGLYTAELRTYEELEEVYDNINDEMQRYIHSIECSPLPNGIDSELLKKNISTPQMFLTPADRNIIHSIYNSIGADTHRISIVNFNYTTTIEKILNFKGKPLELGLATYHINYKTLLENVFHIHGLSESPILGINDSSQISNEELRTNLDVIEYLVKPQINSTLGHLIDRKAREAIKEARLICIYGLSLGKTDSLWWKLVGERLLNGATVILFVYDEHTSNLVPRKFGRYQRSWKTKLCDMAKIQDNQRDSIMSRIIVAQNTPIFDIKSKTIPTLPA